MPYTSQSRVRRMADVRALPMKPFAPRITILSDMHISPSLFAGCRRLDVTWEGVPSAMPAFVTKTSYAAVIASYKRITQGVVARMAAAGISVAVQPAIHLAG